MLSVKDVYNKIAPHFDVSRQRVWGSVKTFLTGLPPNAHVLDLGCGNGKNMLYRTDLQMTGVDNAVAQVDICLKKQLQVHEADITDLPFQTETFDYMLCVATYHHLDSDSLRQKALQEIHRCLKPGGRIHIVVWALEQHEGSTFNFTKSEELVPWTTPTGETYMRYYRIYKAGELEMEIERLAPELTVLTGGWELGNWFLTLQKSSV